MLIFLNIIKSYIISQLLLTAFKFLFCNFYNNLSKPFKKYHIEKDETDSFSLSI